MSAEKWSVIPGTNGYYCASDHGRIKSVDRYDSMGRFHRGTIMSQMKKPNGYLYFTATIDGHHKNLHVHRAVMLAFRYREDADTLEVDHVDCNKGNNALTNLEWVDSNENMRRAKVNGRMKSSCRKLSPSEVSEIAASTESQTVLAKRFGVTQAVISLVKRGRTYTDQTTGKSVNRTVRGENSPTRNFSDEQVRAIRRDGRQAAEIARDYGCSRAAIYGVKEKRTYKWVVDSAD